MPPLLDLHYGVEGFDDGRLSVVAEIAANLLCLPLVADERADSPFVVKGFLLHQVLQLEALLPGAFGEVVLKGCVAASHAN